MSIVFTPEQSIQALISHVTVLTPEQVAEEARTMRQRPTVMRGYAFGLQLPEPVVSVLEQQNARSNIRLSVYPSPRGVAVLCVTLQVEGAQLRTVCNGNEKGVQRWLSGVISTGRANWLLDIEGGKQVAWASQALPIPDPYRLLMSLHESEQLASHHETLEVGTVAAELAAPEAVPSLIPGVELDTLVMGVQFAKPGSSWRNQPRGH